MDREPTERPRLLEQVRHAARARQYSPRTEEAYVGWVRRYVLYHGKRHPAELNDGHVGAFLTHLAVERRVSAATQRQEIGGFPPCGDDTFEHRLGLAQNSRHPFIYVPGDNE